jgi:hypothetical protein
MEATNTDSLYSVGTAYGYVMSIYDRLIKAGYTLRQCKYGISIGKPGVSVIVRKPVMHSGVEFVEMRRDPVDCKWRRRRFYVTLADPSVQIERCVLPYLDANTYHFERVKRPKLQDITPSEFDPQKFAVGHMAVCHCITLQQCEINAMVTIQENRKIIKNADKPSSTVWFLMYGRGLQGEALDLVTDGTIYYPVNRRTNKVIDEWPRGHKLYWLDQILVQKTIEHYLESRIGVL